MRWEGSSWSVRCFFMGEPQEQDRCRTAPSGALWGAIRGVLALVGIGSLGLVVAIASAGPAQSPVARGVAVAGALAFSLQTAVLDALVWPAYFPV